MGNQSSLDWLCIASLTRFFLLSKHYVNCPFKKERLGDFLSFCSLLLTRVTAPKTAFSQYFNHSLILQTRKN